MKPDWKDAPKWANYLVMDVDGTWLWCQREPRWSENFHCFKFIDNYEVAMEPLESKDSVEERPKE